MSTPPPVPDTVPCPVTGTARTATVPLYGAEFVADPRRTYQRLHRALRPVIQVETTPGETAMAVCGYAYACEILADPDRYPTNTKAGRRGERADRTDLTQASGTDHARLRHAVRESLARIDPHALHATVGDLTATLIAAFSLQGSADLVGSFARPLVVQTFSWLMGLSPETWDQAGAAVKALRVRGDAGALNDLVRSAVGAARVAPGADVISWLCGHPAALEDHEVVQQVVQLYKNGCLPTIDLISNTLMLVVTDQQFGDDVMGGSLSLRDALEHVLAVEPPRPILGPRFPPNLQIVAGVHLPAHKPVLVSPAGCAADPVMAANHTMRVGNRSHLGWGGGPHKCPDVASTVAMLVADDALSLLFDSLPDVRQEPGTQLEWIPVLYHRALKALPVRFEPSSPLPHMSA